jgi:hypothetical protein
MADVTRAPSNIDATMLKVFLTPHDSGMFALCAPETPVDADDISPAHSASAIDLLSSEFDVVIVDTAAGLEDRTLAAVERATDLLFVGSMDVACVRSLRKEIDVLDQLGMTTARRHLVLNRAGAKVGMEARDIEDFLGMRVDVAVPSYASFRSRPTRAFRWWGDAKAPVARSLTNLVERFTDTQRPQSTGVGGYRRRLAPGASRHRRPAQAGDNPSSTDGDGRPPVPRPLPTPSPDCQERVVVDPFALVKQRAHEALFARLGMRLFDSSLGEDQLRSYVLQEIGALMDEESAPLSAAERQRLVAEISDDVLGTVPSSVSSPTEP